VIKMQHALKTPGLREIGRRSPYMHDGSLATLEKVIDHYDGGGVAALKLLKLGATEIPTTFLLSKMGADAVAAVDDLVELVAAYGFEFRNEAEAEVAESRRMMMAAITGSLALGLALAIGFAYSLSRPIIALENP